MVVPRRDSSTSYTALHKFWYVNGPSDLRGYCLTVFQLAPLQFIVADSFLVLRREFLLRDKNSQVLRLIPIVV